MTIDYATIKDLTKEDITAKISSGEIEVPADKEERNKFFEFASADPNSDARKVQLDSSGGGTPLPKESAEQVAEPDHEKKETVPEDKPPETPVSEGAASEPVWKKYGYESEQEALEKMSALHDAINDLQQTVDRQNATRGKVGQKAKKLEEQLVATQKRLEEMEKGIGKTQPDFEMPEVPDVPNPGDYDDGDADNGYAAAMADYRKNVAEYKQKAALFQKNLIDRMAKLEQTVTGIAPKVEQTHEFMESTTQTEATRRVDESWNKMWDKEIPKFQDEFNVKTTVPIRRISDAWGVVNGAKTNPAKYDQTVVSAAQSFLSGLSKTDHDNYKKVLAMTDAYYNFTDGYPEPQYRSMRGALVDRGIVDMFKAEREVSPTIDEERQHLEQKNKQASAPSGIPAEKLASGDTLDGGPLDAKAQTERYKDLLTEYQRAMDQGPAAISAFESSPKFGEYKLLRQKLTGRPLPKFHKSQREGFRQE